MLSKLIQILRTQLPEGFEETCDGRMVHFVVPKSTYPKRYHVSPNPALPFISIANQKNHIALYHMGLYADPEHLKWFKDAYHQNADHKLDMGKSCIRWKPNQEIPFPVIEALAQKISVSDWIKLYE